MERSKAWQIWLKSEECLEVVHGCAEIIQQCMIHDKWPIEENFLAREEKQESMDLIKGHIWIFLSELDNCTQKSQWLQKINENNLSALKTNIINKYRQTILDKRRAKDNSPWHACYRRARDVFNRHPDIRLLAEKNGSFYSPQKESEGLPRLDRLNPEFWRSLPAPAEDGNRIRKKEAMAQAGLNFWSGTAEILREKYHLALRIFINFLAHNYPHECRDQQTISSDSKPSGSDKPGADADSHPKTSMPAATPPPEYFQTRLNLEKLAQDLAGQMNVKEKTALVCLYDREMTKTQTAEKLGYAHASGVNYLLEGIHAKMRRFCSLWPGIGAETKDNILRIEFIEMVIQNCKLQIEDRKDKLKQRSA